MAQVLETWADGNAWLEVQFLMANCQGRVLDIACGTGKTMTLLDRSRLDIKGCHISDLLIKKAVERGLPPESLRSATRRSFPMRRTNSTIRIRSARSSTSPRTESVKFIAEAARVTRIGSFHMMPTSRSGGDEGWMKTYQSFHNCSPGVVGLPVRKGVRPRRRSGFQLERPDIGRKMVPVLSLRPA